jgi:Uma2 family endonuclease
MIKAISFSESEIIYPDSDGKPMADNTKQFRWIVTIKENLECLFADNDNVFIAGDLLWYPIEGDNKTCQAPDAMVVFGRPKGDRGSYKQWLENQIAPQVVFEILSPGNTKAEMRRKWQFYQRFGVEEYYLYDPDANYLQGWWRRGDQLEMIPAIDNWLSPRLQIRFQLESPQLAIFYRDGSRFLTTLEIKQKAELAEQQAQQERQRAELAEAKLARIEAQLRAMGINLEES